MPASTNPSRIHTPVLRYLAVIIISAGAAFFLLRPTAPAGLPPYHHRLEKTKAEPFANPKKHPAIPLPTGSEAPVPTNITVASLEALAATDPARALDLALAENDDARRDLFLQSVLHGWARIAPDAAADWAWANQQTIEQGHAFSAIFNSTQQNPDTAVRLARRLSTEHPDEAWSFGRYLISSLAQAGHFATAADYAANTPPEHLVDLLTAAYQPWGSRQPEQALQAAIALDDPIRQNAAFHATIDGWSQTNPQTLAEAAYKFPQGNDRSLALVAGLRRWIEQDPAAAQAWIKDHPLTPEETARAFEQ